MKSVIGICCLLFLSGCASVSSLDRPYSYYDSTSASQQSSGLMNHSSTNMSESDIQQFLNYRVQLPKQNRIALLKLSNTNRGSYYSDEFNILSETIATDVIGSLRRSKRVYDASYLPSMLVPENRTVPYLREAAARFQADLLLAFRENCQSFEKYRFIQSDETKAYCTVEAVLLDTRSGVVPFTIVASNSFSAVKNKQDNNFRETIKKAEMNAVGKSLLEVAGKVASFMDRSELL